MYTFYIIYIVLYEIMTKIYIVYSIYIEIAGFAGHDCIRQHRYGGIASRFMDIWGSLQYALGYTWDSSKYAPERNCD